jgi:AbiV family abortive infection protein
MTKIEQKYNSIEASEFKKGTVYSLYNAFELYGDALIMGSLDRLPRVYSLMKLALEEVAKSLMFLEISILKNNLILFQDRLMMLYNGLESHNPKTKYAIQFLISKQNEFIKYHPNPDVKNEDSPLQKDLQELNILLEKVNLLDIKKNTNLYTSLIQNEFKPPFLSVEENDIETLRHLTFKLLIRAKNIVLKDSDEYYLSIGLDPLELKNLDPNIEARNMHKLKVTYLNHMANMKRNYPLINFDKQ